jgi:anhydro-N-acetylmuramic acid kinase
MLNLGGIANLTAVRPGLPPIAYDTGPGNALIDVAVTERSGGTERFDRDGRRAARGHVDRALLERLLDEPYYLLEPPKTTGKELFHLGYLRARVGEDRVSDDDLVATVTELTVESVAREMERLGVAEIYASGGGTRNPTLMRRLGARLADVHLLRSDELGVPEAAKEALAFGLIGFLTVNGLPGAVPSCTGARGAAVLGSITPGRRPLQLPAPASGPPRRIVMTPPDVAGRAVP